MQACYDLRSVFPDFSFTAVIFMFACDLCAIKKKLVDCFDYLVISYVNQERFDNVACIYLVCSFSIFGSMIFIERPMLRLREHFIICVFKSICSWIRA